MDPTSTGRFLAALLTTALLAGCTTQLPQTNAPDADGAARPLGADAAAVQARSGPDATRSASVYLFDGHVQGTSAPAWSGKGGAVSKVPPAFVDSFDLPADAVDLAFRLESLEGSGMGRIEVSDRNGRLVHTSYTWFSAQDPVGGGGGRDTEWSSDRLVAGSHTVRYYVAGSYDIAFRVLATLSANAPADVAGTQPTAGQGQLPVASTGPKACNDGVDNDGDGAVDHPADPGCSSPADNNEINAAPTPPPPPPPPPTPTPSPVPFTGHVLAPEVGQHDSGVCANYGGTYAKETEGRTWHRFDFNTSHDGWTFAFDVDGMVAEFTQVAGTQPFGSRGQASGLVPAGATKVWVCSHHAVNTDFVLTLNPPVGGPW